ncbi:hypothetical protein EVAR_54162_1 [Eumeta japonica]|uniref:Uncharacterized protein n=1 Tax=Eumeta variegata TaxID=151549 RepID=A0A4C1Y1E2_EUMVA|nr:hypothetical protein EVAR_54162_1 [Eumeta japonica]
MQNSNRNTDLRGPLLYHDNACAHSAPKTKALLDITFKATTNTLNSLWIADVLHSKIHRRAILIELFVLDQSESGVADVTDIMKTSGTKALACSSSLGASSNIESCKAQSALRVNNVDSAGLKSYIRDAAPLIIT